MIVLAYRGRALPLISMSLELKPGAIEDTVTLLFTELRRWLPDGIKVHLAADREFHGVHMLDLSSLRVGFRLCAARVRRRCP